MPGDSALFRRLSPKVCAKISTEKVWGSGTAGLARIKEAARGQALKRPRRALRHEAAGVDALDEPGAFLAPLLSWRELGLATS
jgi:hypothetical protein